MKVFGIPMAGITLLGLCLWSGINGPTAQADFTFGPAQSLGSAVCSGARSFGPCISSDGLELYFHRDPGELWVARRATPNEEWGAPVNLGPTVNSSAYEGGPCLSADGLSLYFFSINRPGELGGPDVWVTTRATTHDNWGTPVNVGAPVNTTSDDWCPSITADGLELYFTSNRPGGSGNWDIWSATRATVNSPWNTPVNLGPAVNSSAEDNWPGISPDGLVLFFASTRPGGSGQWDLYMTRRATRKDPWGPATNLGPTINTIPWQVGAKVSSDGSTLYFHSARAGGFSTCDLWQAAILPIVDFNADRKVDLVDLVMLIDNWGTNKTLCDVGPMPWGDGKVDIEDLKVFMTYYEKENPPKQ